MIKYKIEKTIFILISLGLSCLAYCASVTLEGKSLEPGAYFHIKVETYYNTRNDPSHKTGTYDFCVDSKHGECEKHQFPNHYLPINPTYNNLVQFSVLTSTKGVVRYTLEIPHSPECNYNITYNGASEQLEIEAYNKGCKSSSVVEQSTLKPSESVACPLYDKDHGRYNANDCVTGGDGKHYYCKTWPYTSWCGGSAAYYAPGTGYDWRGAWSTSKQ